MHSVRNKLSLALILICIFSLGTLPLSDAMAVSNPQAAKSKTVSKTHKATVQKTKIKKRKKRVKAAGKAVAKAPAQAPSSAQGAAPVENATATAAPTATGSAVAKPDEKPTPTIKPASAAPEPMKVMSTDRRAAKWVFGSKKMPANLAPRSIGSYARGCLSGAQALPVTGDNWQVMRLSRNRNWGHPKLISLVERLSREAKQDGWNGLLVGDIAQPRGGPMTSGHASHQIGLDADVWLMQMPPRTLTHAERETMSPRLVTKSRTQLDRSVWTEQHAKLIQRAARYPEVARIFVHPPIKAELCRWATGDRSWLAKVRPYYGHNYHFHIRMKCPAGFAGCKDQTPAAPSDGTGCGTELAYWMGTLPWRRKAPDPNAKPPKPQPALTLASLPAECRAVANAP